MSYSFCLQSLAALALFPDAVGVSGKKGGQAIMDELVHQVFAQSLSASLADCNRQSMREAATMLEVPAGARVKGVGVTARSRGLERQQHLNGPQDPPEDLESHVILTLSDSRAAELVEQLKSTGGANSKSKLVMTMHPRFSFDWMFHSSSFPLGEEDFVEPLDAEALPPSFMTIINQANEQVDWRHLPDILEEIVQRNPSKWLDRHEFQMVNFKLRLESNAGDEAATAHAIYSQNDGNVTSRNLGNLCLPR